MSEMSTQVISWINDAVHHSYYLGLTMLATVHITEPGSSVVPIIVMAWVIFWRQIQEMRAETTQQFRVVAETLLRLETQMGQIGRGYIVIAYKVMAYIVMACIVMAG